MCENFHIALISTPARHRQSFGAIERGNQAIKNCLNEVVNSSDYINMPTDEMLAISQLISNGFVSQVDGQTPGHRCFGRAPRLPIPTAETATIFDISSACYGDMAPETVAQKFNANLVKFRLDFTRQNTSSKLIKSLYRKNRVREEHDLRIGQSVYFHHGQDNVGQRVLWRGPAMILGRWDHQALIDYQTQLYRVSIERLRSTANCFFASGIGDESLTLHTQGGAEKLKDPPRSKALRNF